MLHCNQEDFAPDEMLSDVRAVVWSRSIYFVVGCVEDGRFRDTRELENAINVPPSATNAVSHVALAPMAVAPDWDAMRFLSAWEPDRSIRLR